jgi:hypothetical protein
MASLKSLLASIFLSVLSCWCLGNAQNTNTIKPGDTFTTDYLASANGRFHLGFNPINVDPTVIYLAIFYVTGPQNDWLWVANRDKPVLYSKPYYLTMDVDGLVKIVHDGGSPILLNANAAAPNSITTLEDDGNFVVKKLDSKRFLWQSFDYSTHTLLPGMKLGMNFKTQHKWMLTSWLTDKIPTSRGFSIEEMGQDSWS